MLSAASNTQNRKSLVALSNPHIKKLQGSYLFAEIAHRIRELKARDPTADLINLGIGDTTEPIPESIARPMGRAAIELATKEGYCGYDRGAGRKELRTKIADSFYTGITPEEIFVSDGSKPDIGRLQLLFSNEVVAAVQDPSYPVYVNSSVIYGKTGPASAIGFQKIVYLACTPENNFFPDLESAPPADLIFFCSPNNPTGNAATKDQLASLVAYAKKRRSIIIYDSAYAAFIKEEGIPKSIYEIKGAEDVAIETGSFSKIAGFTGVRLGWTVVPEKLCYRNGEKVIDAWKQIVSTLFNGPSYIAQIGGEAALSHEGREAVQQLTDHYLENGIILKNNLEKKGYSVYGGTNSPYLWINTPGRSSWELFESLLHEAHLVTTPGAGFGPSGEGFVRISAFAGRKEIEEAARRLDKFF